MRQKFKKVLFPIMVATSLTTTASSTFGMMIDETQFPKEEQTGEDLHEPKSIERVDEYVGNEPTFLREQQIEDNLCENQSIERVDEYVGNEPTFLKEQQIEDNLCENQSIERVDEYVAEPSPEENGKKEELIYANNLIEQVKDRVMECLFNQTILLEEKIQIITILQEIEKIEEEIEVKQTQIKILKIINLVLMDILWDPNKAKILCPKIENNNNVIQQKRQKIHKLQQQINSLKIESDKLLEEKIIEKITTLVIEQLCKEEKLELII